MKTIALIASEVKVGDWLALGGPYQPIALHQVQEIHPLHENVSITTSNGESIFAQHVPLMVAILDENELAHINSAIDNS